MGCGDVCLLNDEGYRAIEGSSRPPLINLTVPSGVRARGNPVLVLLRATQLVENPLALGFNRAANGLLRRVLRGAHNDGTQKISVYFCLRGTTGTAIVPA